MVSEPASFRIHVMRRLRNAGIEGRFAQVIASAEGLSIKGEKGGSLTLPWAHVERARVGYTETKHGPIYETRLWSSDGSPIRVFPLHRDDRSGYAAAVRILARSFVERGRAARVELGVSKFEAVTGPLLIGIVAAAGFLAAGYAMDPPEWWHFIVIPFVPTVVFAIMIWQAVHVHWPRPLETASDVERQLPR